MVFCQVSQDSIEVEGRSFCYLCGTKGFRLYSNLWDSLFGVAGLWNLNRCTDSHCGLIWIDPFPAPKSIPMLYKNYYTHGILHPKELKQDDILRAIFATILTYANLASFVRFRRTKFMYLHNTVPGRLLDVGCGNGKRLAFMKKSGWEVVGQEIDAVSADLARKNCDCPVYVGELKQLGFPENSFDAITMNHVIEHVADPVHLLRECVRILKPKGKLVAITPNANSIGHKYFGMHWRGLEPPRHLYIFSIKNLRTIAEKAGFTQVRCWATAVNAAVINWNSFDLKNNNKYPTSKPSLTSGLKAYFFKWYAMGQMLKDKDSGEEGVLYAIK